MYFKKNKSNKKFKTVVFTNQVSGSYKSLLIFSH